MRYRVRANTQVTIGGQLHAGGTTIEADPSEVADLVAAGHLVAVRRKVIETKASP